MSVNEIMKRQMYQVTLLHVTHHGQFDVIRMNTRVSPLQTHDIIEDHRVNCS